MGLQMGCDWRLRHGVPVAGRGRRRGGSNSGRRSLAGVVSSARQILRLGAQVFRLIVIHFCEEREKKH